MEIVVDLVLVPKWACVNRADGTSLALPFFYEFAEPLDNYQAASERAAQDGMGQPRLAISEKNTGAVLQEFFGVDCWERANEWLEKVGTVQEVR